MDWAFFIETLFRNGLKNLPHTCVSMNRTPDGTIYLDDKGSVLTKWDPQNGVVEVENFMGFKVMWKREKKIIDHVPAAKNDFSTAY